MSSKVYLADWAEEEPVEKKESVEDMKSEEGIPQMAEAAIKDPVALVKLIKAIVEACK